MRREYLGKIKGRKNRDVSHLRSIAPSIPPNLMLLGDRLAALRQTLLSGQGTATPDHRLVLVQRALGRERRVVRVHGAAVRAALQSVEPAAACRFAVVLPVVPDLRAGLAL